MEREERNNLIEKIRNFVKRDKKGHLKKRCQVLDFIQELLGAGESQHINFFGRFNRLTYYRGNAKNKHYSPFNIVIYFPWEGLEIICSRDTALNIPYIQTLLMNKSFEERPIDIEWIQPAGATVKGPQILISLADSKSIFLKNGLQSLHAALAKY